jgi:hypothetical protein
MEPAVAYYLGFFNVNAQPHHLSRLEHAGICPYFLLIIVKPMFAISLEEPGCEEFLQYRSSANALTSSSDLTIMMMQYLTRTELFSQSLAPDTWIPSAYRRDNRIHDRRNHTLMVRHLVV